MITDTAQKLLASFKGDQNCNNDLFMDYNQTVSAILDLICSNTKLAGPKYNNFSREELRPIAKNFLLHKDTNLSNRLHSNANETLTTDFLVDNTGKFHVVIPHLSFFCSQLHGYDEKASKRFEKKVLKPYAKKIAKGKPFNLWKISLRLENFFQSLAKAVQYLNR